MKTYILPFSFPFVIFEFIILASSTDITYSGRSLHVTMIPNPSHLEASHPVISGKTRSRLLTKNAGHYNSDIQSINKVLSVHVHGDAAISGQVLTKSMQEFDCFKNKAMFWQENLNLNSLQKVWKTIHFSGKEKLDAHLCCVPTVHLK